MTLQRSPIQHAAQDYNAAYIILTANRMYRAVTAHFSTQQIILQLNAAPHHAVFYNFYPRRLFRFTPRWSSVQHQAVSLQLISQHGTCSTRQSTTQPSQEVSNAILNDQIAVFNLQTISMEISACIHHHSPEIAASSRRQLSQRKN